ncbi:hypothetical protein V6N12_019187 [Hibiscus sabdariffa]|uniref:Fe2OG dioxygenase domain-containing protein n=1 Tax=Hibiscus sabdariffa TaxID=183260 RepID=A0ABR1ZSI7_9ROSI
MEQCQAEMKTLCNKIVGIMLGSLGLTHKDDMNWFQPQNGSDQTQCLFHLNSYLCNISGLQDYQDGAGWVPIEQVEGALVVNVGDLMQIVTNGKFKSVFHHVTKFKQDNNHGVPLSLFRETEFQTRQLFSLPTKQKLLVARPPSGVIGYGTARISPFYPKLMWTAGFGMTGSPVEIARKLWPQDHAKSQPKQADEVTDAIDRKTKFKQDNNHGVPLSLFRETEFQTRQLFSLPTKQKLLVARPPSGVIGYGTARISPFYPKLMWTAGFGMTGSPVEIARKLWPQDHAKSYDRYFAY